MCPSKSFPVFNCPPPSLPSLIVDNRHTVFLQFSCSCPPFFCLQLYEMGEGCMKFGFQLSGTHRPVSHTHTALGLISFANIASPSTTSETQSLALLNVSKLSQKCPNCKHCVTQHHFQDNFTCAFTLRILLEGGDLDLCQ